MKIVTTWGLINTYLCHVVHGKDEWLVIQLEDWNLKPMSYRHCLGLPWISERTHSKTSSWLLWIEILFLKHEIGHECIPIVPLQANSSLKTKFEKVYLWNPLFFLVNHRDELMWRCKMRLKSDFFDFEWLL